MSPVTIETINYQDPESCAQLVQLLDNYARDPMGGGKPLADYSKNNLSEKLAGFPGAFSLLARLDGEAIGFANCFPGFSTFACAPLLNIHDIAVEESARGQGVGTRLMVEIVRVATERGCCKITLEVLNGNQPAKLLYQKTGFKPAGYDRDPGTYEFWDKEL